MVMKMEKNKLRKKVIKLYNLKKADLKVGMILDSKNYGKYKVLSWNFVKDVQVQFIETGHLVNTSINFMNRGFIKDPYKPHVFGIGLYGVGKYRSVLPNGKKNIAYSKWTGMLGRCYDGIMDCYSDCTVAKEWHNFQNFATWHHENYIDGYELDKDIKIRGNRIYGPDTCMYVSQAENLRAMYNDKLIKFAFTSPDGIKYKGKNLRAFCKKHGLDAGNMGRINRPAPNMYKISKGWTKTNNGLSEAENVALRAGNASLQSTLNQEFKLFNGDGVIFTFTNISEFCRVYKLNNSTICGLIKGKQIQHKQWRKVT